MSNDSRVSRRRALGALVGSVVAVGCGGGGAAEPAMGAGGGGAAGAPGGGVSGAGSCTRAPTPGCKATDDNILGPYYKPDAPFRKDITEGKPGNPLTVTGTVYGCDCVTPLAGAVVDVWQADDAGVYDNAGFALRGRVTTDAQGRYELVTLLPGFYLNGSTYRPRHIHFKVSHPQGVALTTQLYFEGDPWIPSDPFVKESLVMPLTEVPGPGGQKAYAVTFDIVLA